MEKEKKVVKMQHFFRLINDISVKTAAINWIFRPRTFPWLNNQNVRQIGLVFMCYDRTSKQTTKITTKIDI